MQLQVKITQDALGVMSYSPTGEGVAIITLNQHSTPKSANIAFCGISQAMALFDDMGMQVINYSIMNPMADAMVQQSIENIIQHLNENMLG